MTTNGTTVDRLTTLAADFFGKDASALSAGDDFFDALGIDSMQAMELLTRLEEVFDVEIPDYELHDVRTFSALATVIEERL